MSRVRCLSVKEPWATLIVRYGKDCENRDWVIRPGPLVIHASATACPRRDAGWSLLYERGGSPEETRRGQCLGMVDVLGSDRAMRSCWDAAGKVHNRLSNARAFATPFAAKGRLGIWWVEEAAVCAALGYPHGGCRGAGADRRAGSGGNAPGSAGASPHQAASLDVFLSGASAGARARYRGLSPAARELVDERAGILWCEGWSAGAALEEALSLEAWEGQSTRRAG